MAAGKLNYLIVYPGESQVYGCNSEDVALESAPLAGYTLADKKVLFVTYRPDEQILSVHPLPQDKVMDAEIKLTKKQQKELEEQQQQEEEREKP